MYINLRVRTGGGEERHKKNPIPEKTTIKNPNSSFIVFGEFIQQKTFRDRRN
jgi:hypothetical protein